MIILVPAAILAAWNARRLSDKTFYQLMTVSGLLFLSTEILKQIFLYIENGNHYDWWYFPFQLCSVPMYLCLLYPLLPAGSPRQILCTFLHNFSLLGGIAVFLDSSGLYHSSILLTVHSFAWHVLIIFLGALAGFSGRTDTSWRGYLRSLELLLLLCAAATGFNVLFHSRGEINMFYITPYRPTTQIVFRRIAPILGIIPTDVLYVACMAAGGAALHGMGRIREFICDRS